MKKNPATYGGTRPAADEFEAVKLEPPAIIDPAEIGNIPMPCDPHADPQKFDGNLTAALAHKHRDYFDALGRKWVTNIHRDPDEASDILLAATQGLVCGVARPTTSTTEGTAEKLAAAGIIGLYRETK